MFLVYHLMGIQSNTIMGLLPNATSSDVAPPQLLHRSVHGHPHLHRHFLSLLARDTARSLNQGLLLLFLCIILRAFICDRCSSAPVNPFIAWSYRLNYRRPVSQPSISSVSGVSQAPLFEPQIGHHTSACLFCRAAGRQKTCQVPEWLW